MKENGFFAATLLASLAVVLWLAGDTASAQGRGHGVGSTKPSSGVAAKTGAARSGRVTARQGSPQGQGRGKPTTAGQPAGHGKPDTAGRPSTPGEQGKGRQVVEQEGGPKTPQQLLMQNTRLAERLQKLLPPGTDVMAASQGFRNLGQFVAAVHVSHNLSIPFNQLRTKMVTEGMSLGQAIQALRPGVDAEAAARRAGQQAEADMRGASTTSPPSASRKTTSRKKVGV